MSKINIQSAPFRHLNFGEVDIRRSFKPDGSILLHSAISLEAHPIKMTDRLLHWASVAPDRIFLAQRNREGHWDTLSYLQTLSKVRSIAQALLDRNLSPDRPIAILAENSIEHGLLALAALHVGIPYSPITPAYSLRSKDFSKLKHAIDLLTPGLILVSDGNKYEAALKATAHGIETIAIRKPSAKINMSLFDDLIVTTSTPAVNKANEKISFKTIAKILFTSGSTGIAKGVINTHGNISCNWQQITQVFPFLKDDGLEVIDWLPWSHTFGGNHNFGLTLYNGGSFYIDGGNPTPAGITTTLANLRERKPTVYFNVPKGFEELIPFLKKEKELRENFFSRLKMLFYAGATMPQHIWDTLEELSVETVGEKVVIAVGLGCTEASPAALLTFKSGGFSGWLGVPVPGLHLKLVSNGDKWEARFSGPNITQGYFRQPALTAEAFDEDGFFCSGDALKFADINDIDEGMIFDGRLTEDFKLNTGTWVSVGMLRSALIAAGNGLIQEAVITGSNCDFVGAIVFPDWEQCRRFCGLDDQASQSEIRHHHTVTKALKKMLEALESISTGSSTLIERITIAEFTLSTELGEITDKGSVNQRAVLINHADIVENLYDVNLNAGVIWIEKNGIQ